MPPYLHDFGHSQLPLQRGAERIDNKNPVAVDLGLNSPYCQLLNTLEPY